MADQSNRTYYLRNIGIVAGFLLLIGFIVYESFVQPKSYQNLSVREVKQKIDSPGDDYILVDVRTRPEYTGELGHLPQAPLYPIQNLDISYKGLLQYQDQGKDIILYCRSGNRSRRAAQFLIGHGFTNIYNMEGGMRAWNAEYGRPEYADTPPPNLDTLYNQPGE